jgi:hypothetical protein
MGGRDGPPKPPGGSHAPRDTRGAARSSESPTGSRPVLAVVRDLFFVARIRETARLAGAPVEFARTPEELEAGLAKGARFVLLDLTGGFDYARVFGLAEAAKTPVLAFTTHALAGETRPWHVRCERVVTKEALTRELPQLLGQGVTA